MSKLNSIVFAFFACVGAACAESPITTIDRSMDCADICDKYKECIKGDYDTDNCKKQCRDMTNSDDTKKIDTCQECLSGNSCTEGVFNCTSQCAGIIVKSSN